MIYVVLLVVGSIQIKKRKPVKEEAKWRPKTESILMKTCLGSTPKLSYFQLFGLCLCTNQITFSYFPRTAKYCTGNTCSPMDLFESPIYSFMEKQILKIWKKIIILFLFSNHHANIIWYKNLGGICHIPVPRWVLGTNRWMMPCLLSLERLQ